VSFPRVAVAGCAAWPQDAKRDADRTKIPIAFNRNNFFRLENGKIKIIRCYFALPIRKSNVKRRAKLW
jgi:hypothetical protein